MSLSTVASALAMKAKAFGTGGGPPADEGGINSTTRLAVRPAFLAAPSAVDNARGHVTSTEALTDSSWYSGKPNEKRRSIEMKGPTTHEESARNEAMVSGYRDTDIGIGGCFPRSHLLSSRWDKGEERERPMSGPGRRESSVNYPKAGWLRASALAEGRVVGKPKKAKERAPTRLT